MSIPDQIIARLAALAVRVEDVEEKFVRGSGAGGQKINKTSSTVHLRHAPSGVEVRCQRERSQAANREMAWELLCEKLELRKRDAAAVIEGRRELARRKDRQKSPAQKQRMIANKISRSRRKVNRRRVSEE